jgi:heme/copper-type cytochrome/quinol oxidase subunit 2
MNRTSTIYARELRYFFQSVTAYVVISIFLVISGYFFFSIFRYYNCRADSRTEALTS